MILIFGGTTEGRKAVAVCDEAGKPYYYATKGNLQKVESAHGIHIAGTLDEGSMQSFCIEKDVKLIIDAAHPFAEALHQNIAVVSEKLNIPVVRLERNYPEHDNDLLWFDSYNDAIEYLNNNNIDNLLALTGVNTIGKLKPYWQQHHCMFRILDREESHTIAEREGFPFDKVLYYKQGDDETSLFEKLKPQAIITKESGESGGFQEKVQAARKLNIPILVVKRPPLSESFISVYGENGLRKQIEKLLPDFFALKTGYTTGTCATAAAKAALMVLLTKQEQTDISITLPNGEWVKIPIAFTLINDDEVSCTVIKDAGDDPDITNGQEVVSTVKLTTTHKGIRFLQGTGVGKVTLPGLGLEIGETIKIASELEIVKLTLGIMLGKAVKLAEGFLDTHSKKVVMNKEFLIDVAQQSDCPAKAIQSIQNITMARQLWEVIPKNNNSFFTLILQKCYNTCKPLFSKGELEVWLIDEDGNIIR